MWYRRSSSTSTVNCATLTLNAHLYGSWTRQHCWNKPPSRYTDTHIRGVLPWASTMSMKKRWDFWIASHACISSLEGDGIAKSTTSKRSIVAYVLLILTLFLVVIFLSRSTFLSTSISKGKQDVDGYITNVSITITSPQWTIEYLHRNTTNITVATLLFECAAHFNFSVQREYWKGYHSFFITGIHGMNNGDDGRYWQYYVNGEFADVGCSNYFLSDNNVVAWRFETSRWLM